MTRHTSTSPSNPPDFLTVEEAARVLRIGRTTAYELARDYLAGNEAEGLPVVKVGRQMRVPRFKLEVLLGCPITWPLTTDEQPVEQSPPPAHRERAARHRATPSGDAPRLFSA